ncbi:MAG: hypothetical protein ABI843_07740 [Dokdonella sp.]
MIDFRAAHNTVGDVEIVPILAVDEAYERRLRNDRFAASASRVLRARRA